MRKLASVIKITALITLGVVCLTIIAASLPVGGWRALSVQTGSMEPAISPGDLVMVHRVAPESLGVGDIITYASREGNQTVTHRIVGVINDGGPVRYFTKGDANPAPDMPVYSNYVIGKVERTVPYVGRAFDYARHPIGLLLAIYIPALIIVAGELKRLAHYYKQMQPYIAVEVEERLGRLKRRAPRLATGLKLTTLSVGAALIVAVPAQAAIIASAQLSDNIITITKAEEAPTPPAPPPSPSPPPTTPPPTPPGAPAQPPRILLRTIEFKCALDNTKTENRLPEIVMYNAGDLAQITGGWYLMSSSGRVLAFPNNTVFDPRSNFEIEPDLRTGLKYTGDFLALYNSTGDLIDAVSWGADTTHMNPALPQTEDGTKWRRLDLVTDTNTAADWAVTANDCTL